MFRGPRLAAAKDSRQYVNRVFRQYAKPELMVWRRDLCRAFGIVVRIEKPDADGRILSGSDNKPAVEIGYCAWKQPGDLSDRARCLGSEQQTSRSKYVRRDSGWLPNGTVSFVIVVDPQIDLSAALDCQHRRKKGTLRTGSCEHAIWKLLVKHPDLEAWLVLQAKRPELPNMRQAILPGDPLQIGVAESGTARLILRFAPTLGQRRHRERAGETQRLVRTQGIQADASRLQITMFSKSVP
jgi:hypothetical protein